MRLFSPEMKEGLGASDEESNPAIGKFKDLSDSLDWPSEEQLTPVERNLFHLLFTQTMWTYLPKGKYLYLWAVPKRWGGYGFIQKAKVTLPLWHYRNVFLYEGTSDQVLRQCARDAVNVFLEKTLTARGVDVLQRTTFYLKLMVDLAPFAITRDAVAEILGELKVKFEGNRQFAKQASHLGFEPLGECVDKFYATLVRDGIAPE